MLLKVNDKTEQQIHTTKVSDDSNSFYTKMYRIIIHNFINSFIIFTNKNLLQNPKKE